jgi:tetratricopeptide (TPR) repeat protein
MQQADEQGVAHVSLQCSIVLGQALIQNHDYVHAQQELGRALVRTDKLGLKPLSAKANYLLAATLSASGNQAEALDHYREARQLLDAMRKEPGAESILQRWDLKAMYEAASRQSQAAKN